MFGGSKTYSPGVWMSRALANTLTTSKVVLVHWTDYRRSVHKAEGLGRKKIIGVGYVELVLG